MYNLTLHSNCCTCDPLQSDLAPAKQDKHGIHLAVSQSDAPGELNKRSSILDSEVSEVLFQFDSMLTEIERENLKEHSPSPMPQSPVRKEAPILSQTTSVVSHNEQVIDSHDEKSNAESLTPSESSSCSLDDSGSSTEKSPNDLETTKKPLRNLPKVNEIKQRFILPSKYPQTPLSPTKEDIPRTTGNVKSKIAQMQASSDIELPIVNLPPEEHTSTRRHSKTIQSKIEELTRLGTPKTECVLEQKRSYTPPIVRRKVQSVFFEQTRAKSLEPKLTKSQESLVDKPSKETDDTCKDVLVVSPENAVNSRLEVSREDANSSLEVSHEETNSSVEEIRVPKEQTNESQMTKPATAETPNHQDHTEDDVSLNSGNEDGHLVAFDVLPKSSRKRSEIATPENIELSFKEDKASPKTEKRLSKTSSQDSFYEVSSSRVELMIGVKENGLYSPPHIVDTDDHPLKKSSEYDHLTTRSEYDHLAPLEPSNGIHFHRHRSASDIGAHRVTKLSREKEMLASEVSTK